MIVIKCKPTSAGCRHKIKVVNKFIYKGKPYKKLITKKSKTGGRNNLGRITMRHIGGGHKKKYRIIDFRRNKDDIWGLVERIEYDPNRSAYIALILYKDGVRKYIIYPKGLKINDKIISGTKNIPLKRGNCLPLKNIPIGLLIHNVELIPGKGGQISRSAGSSAQIIFKDKNYVTIKLRSGKMRKIRVTCRATLGEVGNSEYMLKSLGKAGSSRWLGIRPTVRGTAMNPVDHPHGGGEGRNFGKHPVSPYGLQCKGKKTRKNKRTDKFILPTNKIRN